jgi:hypothetical protein
LSSRLRSSEHAVTAKSRASRRIHTMAGGLLLPSMRSCVLAALSDAGGSRSAGVRAAALPLVRVECRRLRERLSATTSAKAHAISVL